VRSSSPTVASPGVPPGKGAGDLLTALRAVPDPRPGGARRHPTAFVLGVLVMSFASAGFESFTGAAVGRGRGPGACCWPWAVSRTHSPGRSTRPARPPPAG